MKEKILVLNPGSTTSKIALYMNGECVLSKNVEHPAHELRKLKRITDQKDFRYEFIKDALKKEGLSLHGLTAVSARGGLLKPIPGGTWNVNEKMVSDLQKGLQGEHASNLGGIMAYQIGQEFNCPAFIVDPVIVDELQDVARFAGLPEIKRRSIFHALNQKAVAREAAEEMGSGYEDCIFIVAHLGGGISVGLHKRGKVVDVNNALDGEGPFSAERSGGLPVGDLVKLCFSGQYTEGEIRKKIKGQGGLVAYMGTSSLLEVEEAMDQGDEKAKEVFLALAYQVGKEIGGLAAVSSKKIDAVILTGGMANSQKMVEEIKKRVSFIGPVIIKPGEKEMEALYRGALRVLEGKEAAGEYQ